MRRRSIVEADPSNIPPGPKSRPTRPKPPGAPEPAQNAEAGDGSSDHAAAKTDGPTSESEPQRPFEEAQDGAQKPPGLLTKMKPTKPTESLKMTGPSGATAQSDPTEGPPGLLSKLMPTKSREKPKTNSTGDETIRSDPSEGPPVVTETAKPLSKSRATRFSDTTHVSRPLNELGQATEEDLPTGSGEIESSEPAGRAERGKTPSTSKLKKARPEITEGDIGTSTGDGVATNVPVDTSRPASKPPEGPGGFGKPASDSAFPDSGAAAFQTLDEVVLPDGSPAWVRRGPAKPLPTPSLKKGKGSAHEVAPSSQDPTNRPELSAEPGAVFQTGKPTPPGPSKIAKRPPPPVQPIPLPEPAKEDAVVENIPAKDQAKETRGPEKSKKKGDSVAGAAMTPEEQALMDVRSLARSFSFGRTNPLG